jgi:hypothetical protein
MPVASSNDPVKITRLQVEFLTNDDEQIDKLAKSVANNDDIVDR